MLRLIFLMIMALTILVADVEGRPRSTRYKRHLLLKKYYNRQMNAHFGSEKDLRKKISGKNRFLRQQLAEMFIRRRNLGHKLFF